MTPRIRQATPRDAAALARVCLLTGAHGDDATGAFCDDDVLADVYALPYLEGPGCEAYVLDVSGTPLGYVVGTADSAAFQEWFSREWWPARRGDRTPQTPGDEWLLPSADDPTRCHIDRLDEFPAHLHIDLLPEMQGHGWGRRLMDTMMAALAHRGAHGIHVGVSLHNAPAQAFYPKLDFTPIAEDDSTRFWARSLG